MKVRVIKEGFMFGSMQKVGAVIMLAKDRHFSSKWMEKFEEPEKEPDPEDPCNMKVGELKAALEEKGIPVPDDAKKADLVELLEAA